MKMNFHQTKDQAGVWEKHACQWGRVGAPLKPSWEDGENTLHALNESLTRRSGRIVILGVTPELVQLQWPQSIELCAYDQSEEMIKAVWQPHPLIKSHVTQARWQCLPAPESSFIAAAGDGALNVLPRLDCYDEVFRELHRVLEDASQAVIRCFIRPDNTESLEEIVRAVRRGDVRSFHALKWRIAMSLVNTSDAAIAVEAIRDAFNDSFPSRSELAKITGWPEAVIGTIDAYKDSPALYSFPTLSELKHQCRAYFSIEDLMYGTYELASRCPTVIFNRIPIARTKTRNE